MLVAIIPTSGKFLTMARSPYAAVMSLLMIASVLIFTPASYGPQESACLALPFLCICLGNTWFGLLISAPIQLLGRISYSFYLLHAFALQIGLLLLQKIVKVASLSTYAYWSFAGICGVSAVAVSCLSWYLFELPFLHSKVRTNDPSPTISCLESSLKPGTFEQATK